MLVRKTIPLESIVNFSGIHLVWLLLYSTLVTVLYEYAGWKWIAIPFVPVTLIGTALAFYLGFKNSQAYDRLWEARKIWGAIVNSSRTWGSLVVALVRNPESSESQLQSIKTKLIYRHIAWLYTLREQLLIPTQWEHVSLRKHFGSINVKRRDQFGVGKFKEYLTEKQEKSYFSESDQWKNAANGATQIINIQIKEIAKLWETQYLDLFHQIELQSVLSDFYTFQGQAERIKKFPLPRQYANSSLIFNGIFIFLLPLGIVAEFAKLGDNGIWWTIPFAALVSWVYVIMELVGDYSENPFEGLANDIPMLAICRTIEIDLLEILGETDLPEPIKPVNDILM
ncbi:MAG: hypothetical protein H6567_12205 [Lewinellaceae bacterium]|nr:hypothetical protein [Lewinellaceae bacterium]